jgi:DNA-binding transcriptional regulator YiaG
VKRKAKQRAKGGRSSARTATRVLHEQRVIDGRTYQHDIVARFDHAAQEYIVTPAQRTSVDEAIAAQVACELPSAQRFEYLRLVLRQTPAALAVLLGVPVDTVVAWERGDVPVPTAVWLVVGDMVHEFGGRQTKTAERASKLAALRGPPT